MTRPHLSRAVWLTIAGRAVLAAMFSLVMAQPAFSHVGGEVGGGFWVGFHHPISGLDHVLAMMAVGIWGAQLGSPSLWALPVAFPLVMTIGGILGILGIPIPSVEIGIAASVIVLGAMIAFAVRPPLVVSSLIVSIFAIFHGHAHGAELPGHIGAAAYSFGFVVATGCLHLTGIGIGCIDRFRWGPRMLRAAGAAIAAAGSMMLFQLLVK